MCFVCASSTALEWLRASAVAVQMVGHDVRRPARIHRADVGRRIGIEPPQLHLRNRFGEHFDRRHALLRSHARVRRHAFDGRSACGSRSARGRRRSPALRCRARTRTSPSPSTGPRGSRPAGRFPRPRRRSTSIGPCAMPDSCTQRSISTITGDAAPCRPRPAPSCRRVRITPSSTRGLTPMHGITQSMCAENSSAGAFGLMRRPSARADCRSCRRSSRPPCRATCARPAAREFFPGNRRRPLPAWRDCRSAPDLGTSGPDVQCSDGGIVHVQSTVSR